MKKLAIIILIVFAIALSGCITDENGRIYDNQEQYQAHLDSLNHTRQINEKIQSSVHPLREISFESDDVIKTVVVERWSTIIGGGEKSIAYVDKQNVVTFIYGTLDGSEMVYRTMTISRDNVEIVTVSNTTSPYIKFLDSDCNYKKIPCEPEKPSTWNIRNTRFYLPDGWKILKNKE